MSVTACWQHGSAVQMLTSLQANAALKAYVAVRSKRLKSTLKVVTQYLMAGAKLRNCTIPLHIQSLAGQAPWLLVTASMLCAKVRRGVYMCLRVWLYCIYEEHT